MRERGSARVARESPWSLTPGTQVAGFTILGLLASGSFGTVYRAKQDGRLFAIKLVPKDARGDREVDALRRVSHPNVVGFHGYGLWPHEEPRFLVLALELVEGRPLETWAPEENSTALELVRQVLGPIAGTLAAVHAEGVVHRDVKESNIVMREADGQPVLVDFGAAGYEGASRLTTRLPPGTPEYRSPEALRFAREWDGEPYPSSPGDDLWALGVTTYWLLTRTLPFGDRYNPRLVQAILHEPPIPPHELNPRVPLELSALCLRMLEKAPEARFATAGKLAKALEEAAAQADDSWYVPLFSGRRKKKRRAPAFPTVRDLASGRWLRTVGLVLAVTLLRHMPPEEATPRTELTLHHATPQTSSGQEFDSEDMTGEVVSSAEPQRSPTPAPIARAMNSEEHTMFMFKSLIESLHKSRKARALAAASCLAGTACASGPKPIERAPQEDCPAGYKETHKRFRLDGAFPGILDDDGTASQLMPVRPGPITAYVDGDWQGFLEDTALLGQVLVTSNRVYMRFTQARVVDTGEIVPVCIEMYDDGYLPELLGQPLAPGSTPERPLIRNGFALGVGFRFH